jgi:Zn-dependent peptidase ImmA (M78 family)
MAVDRVDVPRDAAAALRQQLALGTGYVDVFSVLKAKNIEVYQAPFEEEGLEGAHLVKEGRAFVFVNNERAVTRQRLTAAHELGHHLLDNPVDGSAVFEATTVDPGNDSAEIGAYRFARYFLMDPDGVRRLTSGLVDERERVAAVAATFVVSPEVAAIHLLDLGLISAHTKMELVGELAAKSTTPSGLLKRYGYRMAHTPGGAPELDAGFMSRAIEAYVHEWIGLAALADMLQLSESEARLQLGELGVPVREPED